MKTPVLLEWNGNVKASEKKTRHQLTNLQFVWVFSPSASSISFNNWIIDLWRLWHVMTNVCSFPNRCPFSERNTQTAAEWNWNLFLKWQAIFFVLFSANTNSAGFQLFDSLAFSKTFPPNEPICLEPMEFRLDLAISMCCVT